MDDSPSLPITKTEAANLWLAQQASLSETPRQTISGLANRSSSYSELLRHTISHNRLNHIVHVITFLGWHNMYPPYFKTYAYDLSANFWLACSQKRFCAALPLGFNSHFMCFAQCIQFSNPNSFSFSV